MNFDDFTNFEEFMKNFGYNNNANTQPGLPEGLNDIPGGFQDMDPMVFTVIGEVVGNIMAGNLPFNVQNAVANWLILVGQAIVTFNSQQQYFQSGPGRYYNIKNKNVTNPFDSSNTPAGSAFQDGLDGGNNFSKKSSKSKGKVNNLTYSDEDIKALECCVYDLMNEVKKLRKEIEDLKNNC